MKKILPRPWLTFSLIVIWMLVQMAFDLGNLIMGIILGLFVPLVTLRFWPNAPKIKSLPKLAKYMAVFLYDVVIANLQVAVWILGPKEKLRPRWLYVPLDVKHPFTITMLASTISLTPGTVSSQISADRKLLIVHCLHTDDDDESVRTMKERYEKPLKEIFG